MKSRDYRGGDKSTDLVPGLRSGGSRQKLNEDKVNTRVTLSDLEPRPTCKFEFKWVLGKKSLRVTKPSDGPKVVAWVRPETKTHESTSQTKNTTDLDQPIGPFDVGPIGKEVILQNHLEASSEAECKVNSMGQLDDPIEEDPTVAELAKEEEGSVSSDADAGAEIPCGPPPVKATLASSDSLLRSLVRVDLAENIHLEDLDTALVLGSTL